MGKDRWIFGRATAVASFAKDPGRANIGGREVLGLYLNARWQKTVAGRQRATFPGAAAVHARPLPRGHNFVR